MTCMHNPRSAQYKQAYAWMTLEQRQHAYLTYKQEQLREAQNSYASAVQEQVEYGIFSQASLDKFYRKVVALENQVYRLERSEHLREQKRNYRINRSFKPD